MSTAVSGLISGLIMGLLLFTALFMTVLVLIQRGKGGGLAGAFGGMGGQSAFGTKAGDLFTKITIGVATFWIVLCLVAVKVLGIGTSEAIDSALGGDAPSQKPAVSAPVSPDKQAPGKQAAPVGKAAAPATVPVEKSPAK
jgi:preprotein translocase subunit SecG